MRDRLFDHPRDRRAQPRERGAYHFPFSVLTAWRGIRLVPTRFGLFFVVILFGMLLGSINYNNNLGFVFTFLLGGIAAVSAVHALNNLMGVRIIDAAAPPVFAGRGGRLDITVQGRKNGHHALAFCIETEKTAAADVPPGQPAALSIALKPLPRGVFPLRRLRISSLYPLGLFACRRQIDISTVLYVYPGPLSAKQVHTRALFTAAETPGGTGADDFKGLRAFQVGDSLQHVFWKPYARGQGLVVKEFETRAGPSLVFNFNRVEGKDVEARLSRLCTMILKADARKLRYGLRLPDRFVAPADGPAHRHRCLGALAAFHPGSERKRQRSALKGSD